MSTTSDRSCIRSRIILRSNPPSFVKLIGTLPDGVAISNRLSGKANVIVYFTDQLA